MAPNKSRRGGGSDKKKGGNRDKKNPVDSNKKAPARPAKKRALDAIAREAAASSSNSGVDAPGPVRSTWTEADDSYTDSETGHVRSYALPGVSSIAHSKVSILTHLLSGKTQGVRKGL